MLTFILISSGLSRDLCRISGNLSLKQLTFEGLSLITIMNHTIPEFG